MNQIRESISIDSIDMDKCYYNPGCALIEYKPETVNSIWQMLKNNFGYVKLHSTCCRYDPKLPDGSVIIADCAGCDRRFRSLYEGIETITLWEVLDSIDNLPLPDYKGAKMSVHDSCGYRHKPQIHRAIRSLLSKMNIQIVEAEYHGENSVCCGDNFYGYVDNDRVEKRIQERANQFPCEDVVVYCIGCLRGFSAKGITPRHLVDLLLNLETAPILETLDEYHAHARFTENMLTEELVSADMCNACAGYLDKTF
ncbi:MAG: (Fe-S)-binding protein [Oscillospiraceae bacterium]|nr:(Fe-S)-binding protein [Oscillospiraceae bacterium]